MTPHTIPQTVLFPDLFDKPLVATFNQEHASSDGGAVLLKAAERVYGLVKAFCPVSGRQTRTGEDSAHARGPDRPAGLWHRVRSGAARSCRAGRRATPRSPTRRRRSSRVGGPAQLDNGKWGAGLEGPRVAELPKNDRLPGTPIRVTDRTDQSWTTTLTEVVDRTDTTIVVKNSGRPRS